MKHAHHHCMVAQSMCGHDERCGAERGHGALSLMYLLSFGATMVASEVFLEETVLLSELRPLPRWQSRELLATHFE